MPTKIFSFSRIICLVLCLYSISIHAQKVSTFQHNYTTPIKSKSNSDASSIVALPDKGFLISGINEDNYDDKILIIRTDSLGKEIWSKTYTDTGTGSHATGRVSITYLFVAVDMVLTPEGNVVVCSNTFNSCAVFLFKINLKGSVLWSKTFLGGNNISSTFGTSIINYPGGGYLITGASNVNSRRSEMMVIHTDSDGNIIWSNSYYHTGFQGCGLKIIPSHTGDFFVVGFSFDTLNNQYGVGGNGNFLITKIDKKGNLVWSKVYSDTSSVVFFEAANTIIELPDNSIYLCGIGNPRISSFGGSIIKLDSKGSIIWSKIYTNSTIRNIEFRSAVYDSIKKQINISTEFETKSYGELCGLMTMETSGKVILCETFGDPKLYEYGYRGIGDNLVWLPSGEYVLLQSSIIYAWNYFFIKMDTSKNTHNCNSYPFSISSNNYPLKYLYSYTSASIRPKVSTGCTVSPLAVIDSVFCPPFIAAFGWDHVCSSNKTLFYDSSYYKATNWKWDFGDPASANNISKSQNPFHIYTKTGKYQVKLIAGNGTVTDSITRTVTILPSPVSFNLDTLICAGNQITINASGAAKYVWRPGNQVKDSTAATQILSPKNSIKFIIQATGSNGCAVFDTVRIKVDHKPAPPKITYATVVYNNEIDIHFIKSDSADVKNYILYRSDNGGPYIVKAGTSNFSNQNTYYNFVDQTVSAGIKNYTYKILAVDSCGGTSDTSISHQPVLLSVTHMSCSPGLHVQWSAYKGWPAIKNVGLWRSVNHGNFAHIANFSSKTLSYNDTGLNYKNTYCYKILANDLADTFISQSNIACLQPFYPDTPRVLTLSKLSTSTTNGSVLLKWQSINKPGYAYTMVYYAKDGKNYILINGHVPAKTDSLIFTGLNTQTADQYFYLISVDSCGQQSARSLVNKTMDLSVSVGQLVHKLNWTPYYGFRIKKYNIERLEKGTFVTIDTVAGNDTFSREFPAPCNYAIRYRIVAVGYNAGEYSWSDTMGRQAIDTQPPNKVIIKDLILKGQVASINYTGSDSPDVYKYVVERSINGKWAVLKNILFTKPGTKNQLIDSLKNLSTHACYTIITLDSCLNAAVSDTVCGIQINIKSLFCTKHIDLAWNACSTDSTKHIATCPDSLVIYRSDNGKPFKILKNMNGNTGSYVDTNIQIGGRYVYKMSAYSKKNGIYSYSDTISTIPRIIPEAGGAQLVYSTVIKTDPKYGQIFVQWKRSDTADTNARGYYIYSFDTISGKYTLLRDETNLNITSYTNTNINTLQHSYKYYIITYNVCNTGSGSAIHKPVLLKIKNRNLRADLTWSDYLGEIVKTYSVYKSIDGGKPFLLKNAGIDSALVDSNIHCTHSYTYQIQAMLANGKISFSDSVTIKVQDTIKPITQPILFASVNQTGSGNGQNQINWNPALDKNLAGYNLYRSMDGKNWYLDRGLNGLTQIDTDLNTYGQAYYYKIQPIDSCGNLGAFSSIHKTIHLKANAGNQFINLNWNSYLGWIVKGYEIYRNGTLIGTQPKDSLHFRDTLVVCTQLYKYKIKAICDSTIANLYSESNTDSLKSFDHKSPERVYIKTVTVSQPNKSATITWAPSASYDVKNYYIYLKSGPLDNLTLIDTTDQLSYTDSISAISAIRKISGSDDYCYYIFAHDHCQNISPGSNEGCIIFLNANNQSGHNDLTWNSYKTWYDGIQSYNVYKNEDNTGWNLIGTTSSGPVRNYFTDKNLGDTTINFCYQVEAVENPGQYNQISRSTVACVHQDATVFIPNTFTHYNLDGLNDYFAPKGLYIKNYTMRVYNRWGEMVFSNNHGSVWQGATAQGRDDGASLGWDGTFKGADVPEGVYIYMITVEDYNHHFTNFKGNVTVFR